MIGIDTFSWNKLILLVHSEWQKPIEELIVKSDIFITVEGKKEFEYRFPDELDLLDNITVFPILNTDTFKQYRKKYDLNDSSLLEYCDIKGYRIISEDRPLLEEGITNKKNILQLIDFFYELYISYNFFSRTEMYHLINLFRTWKNIKEKKAKFYKNHL